jgi:antitoxin Xre/MbcA/ParS-like protein
MATDLEAPECVLDLRERICRHCLGPLPPSPVGGPGPRVAAKGMCDRCLFLLLLEAITDHLPAAEVAGWMERPNHVLGGRTPRECIDARDFESAFEAVWLYGPPEGPVS